MTKNEVFTYSQKDGLTLHASFYRSTVKELQNKTIIYFHGGGLIWGDRNDLPKDYIQLFLQNGFHFLTLDYRLAPETKLDGIYQDIQDGLHWFHNEFSKTLRLNSSTFILFGRSAGAYLAFLAAKDKSLPKAVALIIFYGYSSIRESFYLRPSPHYLKFPKVTLKTKNSLVSNQAISSGNIESRYAIYIYCRQNGTWLNELFEDIYGDLSYFSLTKDELTKLPPTFITHSQTDHDVPYSVALRHKDMIPNNHFFYIQQADHDFDTTISLGLEVYQNVIRFLINKVN